MANFSIIGRHALLFDDDAGANFVNSATALVPWGADSSLLIDRHDVRHLLDRVPLRPKPGYIYKSEEEVAEELVVDQERFLDLPSEDKLGPNETEETSKSQGAYAAVSFSYGSTEEDTKPGSELKPEGSSSCYRPPFPLPDSLLNNLPPSEKVHQIIARSAKFVSEHGGQSEIVLRVKQGNNPTFGFLLPDHHLHPYFRFLVENSNLLKTEANSDKGALSLLGSVYGSAEDEDEAITPLSNAHPTPKGMEIEKKAPKQDEKEPPLLTGEKPALAKKNPSIAKRNPSIAKVKVKEGTENVGPAKSQVVMMEPSSVMKIAMEKIAEFIHRNGRELEAVLINQDRSTNNFPFLVPTNAYHPYYLKILEDAKERKKSPEKRAREPTPSSQTASREPSEEPQVPEKFKMAFGKTKKPEKTEATNQNLRAGLTTQEAAAIVRAATRGVSPSFRPELSKSDLGQDKSGPGPTKPGGIDEDWIAKTIAKTAALVSSEAASVSKEEKIKAERLKRAKMFASMIKTGGASGGGPPLPQLLNKVESSKVEGDKGSRSNEDDDGENSKREKLEEGRSEREKRHREKNYRKHGDLLEERERSEKRKSKYSDEETCEGSPRHDKKHHNHRHHREHRQRVHSSSDEERERTERKRERHSYNNKGHGRKRERSRHRKSYSSSDSEEEDRRYRQSHRDERRRSSKRSKDERERSLSNVGEKREDSADVPDELRAKIRAMLMETL
ncbi:splicing factor, suppressor of white-apricot isoform X2 [Carex littledalei]|uniref:Splicing factor, suppressor of white-apricot isoform X2 n=1 Tax=Carex littledalei TaxID=544730 RepID=A0A833QRY6_9POAL|nr:splicing factor, suppressor of white-apricot isoform X2 [Carex littledalei]